MIPTRAFEQQHSVVPERLRYATHAARLSEFTDDLEQGAAFLVAPGYFSADHCVEILCAIPGVDEHPARRAVNAAWANLYGYQQYWVDTPGDWVRFDGACTELADQDILVRQNFTCCRTCGDSEIANERGHRPGGQPEWGFVYFTQHDAYGLAAQAGSLWLSFELFDYAPSAAGGRPAGGDLTEADREQLVDDSYAALTGAIVTALRGQGLTVAWDGDPRTRIQVNNLDWRRPLPQLLAP